MKSIPTAAAFAVVSLIGAVMAQQPTDNPSDGLTGLKTPKYLGCYSSGGSLVDMGEYTFQAMGWCQPLCIRQGKSILAFSEGSHCLCGDSIPPGSAKIDDSSCQTQCAGYPQQKCGGSGAFMVYDDGYKPGDPTGTIKITAPSPTAAPTIAAPVEQPDSQTHVQASTVFVTQSGTSVPSVVSVTKVAETQSTPGPNKAAIAAGVVVSIVGLAAIIGGVVLFMRRKKQKALEEERRRHEDQTRLATGEKPPSTYSLADSRLEPSVMFQRRQSDGSIMDNQDYSRRILKVTNPDDR